jgi:hypothetical protein
LNKLALLQEILDLACVIMRIVLTGGTFKSVIDDLVGIGWESRTKTNNLAYEDPPAKMFLKYWIPIIFFSFWSD